MKMKTNTLKAVGVAAAGLSALLMGSATAQSTSKPVGYETITIDQQFNYMGLRLLGAPVASGSVLAITFTDGDATGQITLDGATVPDGQFIVEILDGEAAGAVMLGDVSAGVITLDAGIFENLAATDSVTIRNPQTLASVFGDPIDGGFGATADPTKGLTGAGTVGGADLVLVPESTGFTTYWFFDGGFGSAPTWRVLDPASGESTDVNGSDIPLVYTDGVIINNRAAPNSIVVSGSVKTTATSPALVEQFTFLSTVYPAGATLATAFNTVDADGNTTSTLASGSLDQSGAFGGADVVLVPTASGFDSYWYFDGGFGGMPTWRQQLDDVNFVDIDATTVSFEDVTSVIVQNRGDQQMMNVTPPDFYNKL